MSILGFIKNGRKQKLNLMPAFYPASRVSYNGGNASDALDGKVSKSGDTMTGALNMNRASENQIYIYQNHSSTSSQPASIYLGNNIPDGSAGSCYGRLRILGKGTNYTILEAQNSTANRVIGLPDNSGTIALVEDYEPVDVSNKFTVDSTNTNSKSIYAYKVGKVVHCSGYFSPKAMTTLQNKDFVYLDSSVKPKSPVTMVASVIKDYTSAGANTYSHLVVINTNGDLYTPNIGGWTPIGAVTTNTRVYFNGSWITN